MTKLKTSLSLFLLFTLLLIPLLSAASFASPLEPEEPESSYVKVHEVPVSHFGGDVPMIYYYTEGNYEGYLRFQYTYSKGIHLYPVYRGIMYLIGSGPQPQNFGE